MGSIGIFKHSNFQAWVLFKLFEDQKREYRLKDLLNQCCDSAIMKLNLNENEWGQELRELKNSSLISANRAGFLISPKGIIYVRQNLTALEQACNDSNVPKDIEYKEDVEIQEALKTKTVTIGMLIKRALDNVQSVRSLAEIVFQHTSG